MKYRKLGKTNYIVSEISLGCWQLGGKWGQPFNEKIAQETLDHAISNGVNFFDTADVYREGRSENFCGQYVKSIQKDIMSKIYENL